MQRVFTEAVHRQDGTVKWPAGLTSADYGVATWDQIEADVGKPLDEFSRPLEDAAAAALLPTNPVSPPEANVMGDAGQPGNPAPAPAGPALAPAREPPESTAEAAPPRRRGKARNR